MDRFVDVLKLGPGALIGAVLGFLVLTPLLFGASSKPEGCSAPISMRAAPGTPIYYQCLMPDGSVSYYEGHGIDDFFIPGTLGGLAGAGVSFVLFRKTGWGGE